MVLTRSARQRSTTSIGNALNTVRTPVESSTDSTSKKPKFSGITISTWNIVDGWGNCLELACRQLQRLNIDIGLRTETKLNGRHTVSLYDYNVVSTKCRNKHQGGVTLVYRDNEYWHIESPEFFGDNVLKCTLVHEGKQTVIVGMYIPPSEENMETIQNLDKALNNVNFENLVLLGDFNVNYDQPKNERAMKIVDSLRTFGLGDLSKAFKPRQNKCFNWRWRKIREGKKIQSLCDYFFIW